MGCEIRLQECSLSVSCCLVLNSLLHKHDLVDGSVSIHRYKNLMLTHFCVCACVFCVCAWKWTTYVAFIEYIGLLKNDPFAPTQSQFELNIICGNYIHVHERPLANVSVPPNPRSIGDEIQKTKFQIIYVQSALSDSDIIMRTQSPC